MTKKLKGSLTVFVALILVVVMTLIFTMAECIRLYELHDFSQEYTDMAVESAFSEYNPYLWKNYRILAIDLGYGSDVVGPSIFEQKTMDYCRYNANIETGKNYARLYPEECRVDKFALLTDCKGQGVVMLGEKAARDGMAVQIIDGVQSCTEDINSIEKVAVEQSVEAGANSLNNAKNELYAAKQRAREDDDPNTNPDDYPEPGEVEDNPLDAFQILKEGISKGVLSTVVDAEGVSEYMMDLSSLPSHRILNTGSMQFSSDTGLVDKALFIDYLISNYNYFGNDKNNGPVKYELEYLISGKESDAQALAAVVEELLLVREGANYMTIIQNPSMSAQAAGIANILAGFTMNPAIIEAVKYAIIGAWAYIESTLDIRLLLSGGRVPLLKTIDDWTTDVWHLSAYLDINQKAKPSKAGIGYMEYLIGFMSAKSNEALAMRACDVMEMALNATEEYKDTKLDNMMFAADVTMSFNADQMFLSLLSGKNSIDEYSLTKTKSISY